MKSKLYDEKYHEKYMFHVIQKKIKRSCELECWTDDISE